MSYLSTSGADPNNLGYFATEAALVAAYPVGYPGAFALVGSTDTIWVWDEDSMQWVNTGGGVGGVTVSQLSGIIDGSNTNFVALATPKIIITDAGIYVNEADMQNPGMAGFTLSGLNVTLPIGPNFFALAYY